ncbi:MAG: hypothetical protein KAQ97_04295 [Candidatus Fermentibacteraceae bacterium]|nr:hypothetical protein [Candidatus Fermentibacteraceae bacterium]
MFKNFLEIRQAAKDISDARVSVPMGHDPASMNALITAVEEDLASVVVFGPVSGVKETLSSLGKKLPSGIEIVDTDDPEKAAAEAVRIVSSGEASILMKGMLKTSIFQKAMLDTDTGLRTGRILSHVALVYVRNMDRLIIITDGGMNIRPEADTFVQIALNASDVIMELGAEKPLVALLSAIETENPKMPETILFSEIASRGIPGLEVLGPVAVDGALDTESALIKNISGPVAGKANILVVPDIACGNILAKGLMYMAGAEIGGLIMGAAAPVVMLSRSDKPLTKLNSLALGVVVSGGRNA